MCIYFYQIAAMLFPILKNIYIYFKQALETIIIDLIDFLYSVLLLYVLGLTVQRWATDMFTVTFFH